MHPPSLLMSELPDSSAGAIAGTVRDLNGDALPGATVEAAGPATAVRVTDDEGRYRMVGLPPGRYTVTAELEGFETAEQAAEVRPRETATVDFTLQLQGFREH